VTRLDLSVMHILEFEERVKKYVHPINRGRVSVDQLTEAFHDTPIFDQLRNPYSVVYKLLFSPFFKELKLTHNARDEAEILDTYVMSDTHQRPTPYEERKQRA